MQAIDERVPADVSAAAFWLVAAAIHPDAELTPARCRREPDAARGHRHPAARWAPTSRSAPRRADRDHGVGEPLADLVVRSSELHAIDLGPAEVAAAIDEIPVLCLAAARARGTTTIRGAGELRHKESDRIAGHRGRADGARGADRGRWRRPAHPRAARRCTAAPTDSLDDHRLAMTFAIAGLVAADRDDHRAAGLGRHLLSRLLRPISKGYEHDEARRPHRPSRGPFAVGGDAAGRLRRARHRRDRTSSWDRAPIALADAIVELRGDDFLGAERHDPAQGTGRADGRPADRGGRTRPARSTR